MRTILFIILIINSSLLFAQKSQNEILHDLILKYKNHQVTQKEIHNELGVPRDTLKKIFNFVVPTYPKLGLSFVPKYIGYYNYFIIDITKFKTEFKSEFLHFTPKLSFKEFITINQLLPFKVIIEKQNLKRYKFSNRIFLLYNNFEIISEPLSDEIIRDFEKQNLIDLTASKINNRLLSKIQCNYIYCTFSWDFPPKSVKPVEAPPEELIPTNPTKEIASIETDEADYIGGRIEFEKFLEKNLIFPEKAKNSKIEGKVYVRFVINADGTSKDYSILKYVGFDCDEEAIRLIKLVPKWIPRRQNGKYVESEFTYSIAFKLPL